MGRPRKIKYEDKISVIDKELRKRRHKWHLNAVAWFDFEDVEQIIRFHIFKKWDQWDQKRQLEPWINKIISNQLKNILRNHYSNFARPCLNCPFNQSEQEESVNGSFCAFTPSGKQCGECKLYAKWEKTKKPAYDIKMAVTLESHIHELSGASACSFEMESAERKLHAEMKKVLSKKIFLIYHMLFIKNILTRIIFMDTRII